jgi:DEAD_2.
LNTLIDQIENDDLLEEAVTLKGKNNYNCVHPMDHGAPVDDAICQRMAGFDCEFKERYPEDGGCPYYGKKELATTKDTVVTNLSYLMTNSMIPSEYGFEPRTLLEIDEVQNVENFALQFIGFTIDESSIPINFGRLPMIPEEDSTMEDMVEWLQELSRLLTERANELSSKSRLTDRENNHLKKIKRIRHRVINFLHDQAEGKHWTKTHDNGTVELEPVFIGRFIDKFLWSQLTSTFCRARPFPKVASSKKSVSNLTT